MQTVTFECVVCGVSVTRRKGAEFQSLACSRECASTLRVRVPVADRMWSKVSKGPGCWVFTGSRNVKGYGVIRSSVGGKPLTDAAHRVAWESVYGPIPRGRWVLHHCDNPACVKATGDPAQDHLYLGSPADNVRDRDGRGRNGVAKMTPESVAELRDRRAAGEKLQALADRFGISISQVSSIAHGRDWH